MAIDLTQVQQRVVDDAQSRLAEETERVGDTGPGRGAARFEQLMESPQPGAAPPTDAGAGGPGPVDAPPAGGGTGQTPLVGDRILANLSSTPVQTPGVEGPHVTASIGDASPMDIGDPLDSIELQMQVARIKEATGLATTAVQKSSQGVDTLLKSQ